MFLKLQGDQCGWTTVGGKRKRSDFKVQIHCSWRLARTWGRINWENPRRLVHYLEEKMVIWTPVVVIDLGEKEDRN